MHEIGIEDYEKLRRGEIKEPIIKPEGFILKNDAEKFIHKCVDRQGYRYYTRV